MAALSRPAQKRLYVLLIFLKLRPACQTRDHGLQSRSLAYQHGLQRVQVASRYLSKGVVKLVNQHIEISVLAHNVALISVDHQSEALQGWARKSQELYIQRVCKQAELDR